MPYLIWLRLYTKNEGASFLAQLENEQTSFSRGARKMMLTDLFSLQIFAQIVKVIVLLVGFAYALFAFIVVREVHIMTDSFKNEDTWLFSILAWINFFSAVVLTAISLLFLSF
ncbi:MAG TPA: DUF5657 family protein [Candidatus Saccharimonadales bacterium]|nr:DUF5657 family protein [Candidatus Saccharimonadales bacterium]